ncbi:MAG: SDR family oxidoreductase [Candidatus Methylomirabilales bacterium]
MRPSRPISPVLVTGATGFIGSEVVRCLLASGRPVLTLARARQGQSAAERVGAAVGFTPDGWRLNVVEADLTRPGCGFDELEWRRLCHSVETVIHCAGDATFFPEDMTAFRAAHIDGPVDLLYRLQRHQLRRWIHLSTAYVCGKRSGTVLEREGDLNQDFHNPYERVKLESEVAIRGAGIRLGIDVRVLRPSIVVGGAPRTAGGMPSNLFFGFIRLAASLAQPANGTEVSLRIEAAPEARFNIVPLEFVAAAVVALAEHPDGVGKTFHLVVSDPPTQQAMLTMITKRLGLRGLLLVDSLGAEISSPLERTVARMLSRYLGYLQQDVRFDDATTRRLLDRCGLPGPNLSAEAVNHLIDCALSPVVPFARAHKSE